MSDDRTFTQAEAHRFFAADTFNKTWGYLDRPTRTEAESQQMLALAQTSFYHWSVVGQPLNWARAHWLLARVYAVLGKGAEAMAHGRAYLALVEEHSLYPFDRAYAYEAMARAAALLGQGEESRRLIEQSRQAAQSIIKEEDRQLVLDDLAAITAQG